MTSTFSLTKRFDGKHVLITGGSSGIGRATAERIATEGGQLLLTGTNKERLADVKARLPNVETLVNDSADPNAAQHLADVAKASPYVECRWLL